MAVYSALQVFPGLETSIRTYFPLCAFYFGEDDENREAQPPKVIWDIGGGDPTGIERQTASEGVISPKSFAADMMQMSALLMGAPTPSTALNEKDARRQAYASSEYLMAVLRWALKKSNADGWLGAYEWHGWTVVEPSTSERGALIECHFAVKVQLMAPETFFAEPPITETFFPITIEH